MDAKKILTNKSFCVLPWTGFELEPNGNIKNCIISASNLGNIEEQNITSILSGEENLKIKHYIKIGEECSICYDDINHKDNAYLTDCGHSFHKNCINKWLMETKFDGNCPICRQDIGIYDGDTYFSGNSLDKLECLWLDYDKIYPKYCSYGSKFTHIKGVDKYCDDCLKYREFG